MEYSWSYWRDLNDSERSIYMEFCSPIVNNVRVMPGNNDIVNDETVFPSDEQIERVLNNPENIGPYRFTDGQRNAILYWIEQHPDYMQNYYDNITYNLTDNIPDDTDPYHIELEESSDEDSSDEDNYGQEN